MLDGAGNTVNELYRHDGIEIFRCPVFVGRCEEAGNDGTDVFAGAHLAAGILQRLDERRDKALAVRAIDQKRFRSTANAGATHLGIDED